ncbi:hypothetical protein Tco_1358091 [Tanacetum coccineum]
MKGAMDCALLFWEFKSISEVPTLARILKRLVIKSMAIFSISNELLLVPPESVAVGRMSGSSPLLNFSVRRVSVKLITIPSVVRREMLKSVHYRVSTPTVERLPLLSLPIGISHLFDSVWIEDSIS